MKPEAAGDGSGSSRHHILARSISRKKYGTAVRASSRKGVEMIEIIGEPKETRNKLVYICSPYRGDTERNLEYARELTRIALEEGYAPVTPHLYLTQVTDDNDPFERGLGMEAAIELLMKCNYIMVGTRYGISDGMRREINIAISSGIQKITLINDKQQKVSAWKRDMMRTFLAGH